MQTVRGGKILQVTSVVELGEDGSMISTTKKVNRNIGYCRYSFVFKFDHWTWCLSICS